MNLRISRFLPLSEVNGPGRRAVLWVQGCAGVPQLAGVVKHCPGCWNSALWNGNAGEVVSVEAIQQRILDAVRAYGIEGITFSGGEPFQQALALAPLAAFAHKQDLSVVVFSGYTEEFLRSAPAPAGSVCLLSQTDLLVDGPYLASERTGNLPLRGSRNQRLIALTSEGQKLASRVTDDLPAVEFQFLNGETAVTGFPIG